MTVSPLVDVAKGTEHESEFLWNEQRVAALPGKSRLACRGGVGPPALCAVRLSKLYCTDDGDHDCARDDAGAGVGDDDPQHEISPTTILDLVAAGLGTGIIPASAASPRAGVNFQPIEGGDAQIGIHARWLRDDANPIRHRLLRHLRAAASSVSRRATG
ncbi:LysR substrate-binding domain-containing protein [Hephaestia caeni]|uniref:LysR substrate-binding domain-containing protein n=1 Tax=Hephaestia caeni TaxID=645617 RepID=UPI000E5A5409|nr:LysR substrate-binding domain-containing protein [Hephaestia caeni]